MSSVIIDPCYFTRQGLREYLVSHRIDSQCYSGIDTPQQFSALFEQQAPSFVFISGQCVDNFCPENREVEEVIARHPDTLFFIFLTLPNGHFNGYLYLRENIIITSKSLERDNLDRLLLPHLNCAKNNQRRLRKQEIKPVALSRAETEMLRMWMSGCDTLQISDRMQIKVKTISSHKGNIKKKINTRNKLVIHQLIKISETLTDGLNTSY